MVPNMLRAVIMAMWACCVLKSDVAAARVLGNWPRLEDSLLTLYHVMH